jgi:hypothetical protein
MDNTLFLYNGVRAHFEILAQSLPTRCPEALMIMQSEGVVIPYEAWQPLDAVMPQCFLSFLSFRNGQPTHMTLSQYRVEHLSLLFLTDAMCDELSNSQHISRLALIPSVQDTSFATLGNALTSSGVISLSVSFSVPFRYQLFPSLDSNEVLRELSLGVVTQKELDELMMYLSFNHSLVSVRCRVRDEINIEPILDMIQLNENVGFLEVDGIDYEQDEMVSEQIRAFSPSIYQWNETQFAFLNEPSPEAWQETPQFMERIGNVQENRDTEEYQQWKVYQRKVIRDKRVAFYSAMLLRYEPIMNPMQGEGRVIQNVAQRLHQALYGELFSFLAGKKNKKKSKQTKKSRKSRKIKKEIYNIFIQ